MPRGATLIRSGEIAEKAYFPLSGVISSIVTLGNGDAVEVRMTGIEGRMSGLERRVGSLETRLHELDEDFAGFRIEVYRRFDRIDQQFLEVNHRIGALETPRSG